VTSGARLRELFERVVDLPAIERGAVLDAAGATPSERERLAVLLAADSTSGGLLDTPAAEWARRLEAEDEDEVAAMVGRSIGPWRLLDLIGQGGSSVVFRATRDLDGAVQNVALKLLRTGLFSDEARRRFRRERAILVQLSHPNLVRLVDGGISEAGIPYIVMELVDGVPLTTHADQHGLDRDARLRLLAELGRAVDTAHRALIVHRDLKPSNILVDASGQLKVLDFGIARLIDEQDDPATATQHRALTPGYAAPEQYGDGPLTTAVDVYALGVLAGELLIGCRLGADAALPASAAAAVREAWRRLDPDLATILRAALAGDPERRYPSARHFAEDIERHLRHEPVSAHPPSPWYRARKFVARHRGGVAMSGLFVAAIVAALGVALWQTRVARIQAGVALAQTERAEAVRQFMTGVFEYASPDASRGEPISARDLLDIGERQVDVGLRDRPVLQADVLSLLGQLNIEIGDFKRADALLERALDASAAAGFPGDVRIRVLLGKAWIDAEVGRFDAAIEHAGQALALLDRPEYRNPNSIANAHQLTTYSLLNKGDTNGFEARLRNALEQDRAALGDNNEYVADQWIQLGRRLGDLGRYKESEAAFQTGIDGYRTVFGENSNRVAHGLNELANMLIDKGDLDGAENALGRALAIRTETVGADHHDTLTVRNNLLFVLETEGRYAEALPQRLELARIGEATGALHANDLVATWNAISRNYRELGRLVEAESAAHKALELAGQAHGPRSPTRIGPLGHLARAQALGGRLPEAESSFREALSILVESDPPNSPGVGLYRAELGNILRMEHRLAEARVELNAAAGMFTPVVSSTNPWRPTVLAALSEMQLDSGEAEKALASAQDALDYARKALPPGHSLIATALYARARAELALGDASAAERDLRESLDVRERLLPDSDPRLLEARVAMARALAAQGRTAEAESLRRDLVPLLDADRSSYAADLRARLDRRIVEPVTLPES
jgi:serine/threonine-protein kinase